MLITFSIASARDLRADEPRPSVKDTAIHVPTPPVIVAKMLEVARVKKDDL